MLLGFDICFISSFVLGRKRRESLVVGIVVCSFSVMQRQPTFAGRAAAFSSVQVPDIETLVRQQLLF